jgi:hypothetical protein
MVNMTDPHSLLTMLLHSILITILTLPVLISGSQISAIDGVTGGVPARDARNFKNLARAVSRDTSTPRTPGKLRVVENSGLCGEVILLLHILLAYSHSWKKLRQVSIRLRDMVTLLRTKASGLYSPQVFPLFLTCDPSTGFGFLPHAKTPTMLPSSRGSMAA